VEALARQALAEWQRMDLLVNAAGVATFAPVTDSKLDDWDQTLAVNLRGAVLCCRAVLPAMIAQHRGTIINIGSVVTSRSLTGSAAYTASKYGLLGFSRVLAEEMRAHGGRVGGLSGGGALPRLQVRAPRLFSRPRRGVAAPGGARRCALGGSHRYPSMGCHVRGPGARAHAAGRPGRRSRPADGRARSQRDPGGGDAAAGGGDPVRRPTGPGALCYNEVAVLHHGPGTRPRRQE